MESICSRDKTISEIASEAWLKKGQEPDIAVEEVINQLIPTRQGGQFLHELKKQKGENEMTNDYNDIELEDWERENFDESAAKWQKWQEEKMQKQMADRQGQLMQKGFEDAAKELGMSPEQLSQMMGEPVVSPEEIQVYEEHFRDTIKRYWLDRASMKQQGGRPRDKNGRFISTQAPSRADIEKAKEAKDAEGVLNSLLPDDDPLFR